MFDFNKKGNLVLFTSTFTFLFVAFLCRLIVEGHLVIYYIFASIYIISLFIFAYFLDKEKI